MITAHVNYLLRAEIVFCVFFASNMVLTILCHVYMSYYVDESHLTKFIFELCFFLDTCIGLFLLSIMGIFYIALRIKFSLLNDYFK